MKPRTLLHLLSAASLAALPLVSHADASTKALEACSQAFIQHLSSTHGEALYRVDKPASRVQANSRTRARKIDLTLFATVTRSGEVIASAHCTTTASGELIAMTPVPVTDQKGLLLSARGAK